MDKLHSRCRGNGMPPPSCRFDVLVLSFHFGSKVFSCWRRFDGPICYWKMNIFECSSRCGMSECYELPLELAIEVVQIQSRRQSRTSDPSLPLLETSFVIVESMFFRSWYFYEPSSTESLPIYSHCTNRWISGWFPYQSGKYRLSRLKAAAALRVE